MKEYIEALLFASPEPLTQSQINGIFPNETTFFRFLDPETWQ